MTKDTDKSYEHVLRLKPGAEDDIELRFAQGPATLTVGVVEIDLAKHRAELALDSMWRGYEMRQFVTADHRWKAIWPDEDGVVHAVVNFGHGEHVNISADSAMRHAIDLTDVDWENDSLRLTFREIA
jgi:hypothetical protein